MLPDACLVNKPAEMKTNEERRRGGEREGSNESMRRGEEGKKKKVRG